MSGRYEVLPVTADRWDDLEAFFGPNGAYGNCWCMWWRVKSSEFTSERNRAGMEALVREGRVPGLLAYRDGTPVGWVSVAPKPEFGRIERSPTLKTAEPAPPATWSIVCFYIRRSARGQGLATALLDAAGAHAAAHGASTVEAYPTDTDKRRQAAELYTGVPSMFRKAGFDRVTSRTA